MGYLVRAAYDQIGLLNSRIPLEKALNDESLSAEEKRKIELSVKVRDFAEKELNLNSKKNYGSFVKLDRPSVSTVVSASPKWKLESYLWSFPLIGKVPYKGFFQEERARSEAEELKKQDLDVYVRGVSAFSTLGWFKDPLLSSMLRGEDHILVNTLIHESVHASLYIKSAADFNERMATFLGNKGMEIFYLKEEGPNSPTLKKVREENEDEKLFSEFISQELNSLQSWYDSLKPSDRSEELRQQRFKDIQNHFVQELLPRLKTSVWGSFAKTSLNNARLLVFRTYMQDLSDFEKLYSQTGGSFAKFLEVCRSLEDEKDPALALKKKVSEAPSLPPSSSPSH